MTILGLQEFLADNPLMRLEPMGSDAVLVLRGKVKLNHHYNEHPHISDWITICIKISSKYPREVPVIEETGGLIPKTGDYHVNPDGTVCLGSPFRLYMALSESYCFNTFYKSFFIPYSYAALLKLKHNIDFVFGELSHGDKGQLEDFCDLFGVSTKNDALDCLQALSKKKRIANKRVCPCGCDKRLGACNFHHTINKFRNIVPRSRFAKIAQRLSKYTSTGPLTSPIR